jgi:hypothetical protein
MLEAVTATVNVFTIEADDLSDHELSPINKQSLDAL